MLRSWGLSGLVSFIHDSKNKTQNPWRIFLVLPVTDWPTRLLAIFVIDWVINFICHWTKGVIDTITDSHWQLKSLTTEEFQMLMKKSLMAEWRLSLTVWSLSITVIDCSMLTTNFKLESGRPWKATRASVSTLGVASFLRPASSLRRFQMGSPGLHATRLIYYFIESCQSQSDWWEDETS